MILPFILLIISSLTLIALSIWDIVNNKRNKKEIERATVSIALSTEVIDSLKDCIIESGDEYCKYCKNATTCNKDFRSVETCQPAIMTMAAQKTFNKRFSVISSNSKDE